MINKVSVSALPLPKGFRLSIQFDGVTVAEWDDAKLTKRQMTASAYAAMKSASAVCRVMQGQPLPSSMLPLSTRVE